MATCAYGESLSSTLDWVPLDDLTQEQRAALPPGSCGAYIAPIREDIEAALKPDEAPIRFSANEAQSTEISNAENKRILMVGDVVITQGYRQLRADRADLDQGSGTLTIEGNIEIREPDLLILGERTKINQKEDRAQVDGATYVLHQKNIRGQARQLNRTGVQELEMLEAMITRCEPGNNAWSLKGSRIKLNYLRRQGHVYHMRLEVKGVPVFYAPYLRFPLSDERLSGFLTPSLRFGNSGTNISLPYYINLAPNYDWLLTPHFLEQHGVLYENHFRHLNRYFYTQLNTTYLFNDRGKLSENDRRRVDAGDITEDQAVPFKGEDRWLVQIRQEGSNAQSWDTKINYTKVSDIDYFRDFDFNPVAGQQDNFLDQKIRTRYYSDAWTFAAEAISYQTLSQNVSEPYEQMPALSADGRYRWNNWRLGLNHQWIDFDHADNSAATPKLTGSRLRTDYRMVWETELDAGFFKPAVQLKHLQYQLHSRNFTANADESPSITVPQFTLDTGLFFERRNADYLQTFEPRLFYFYSDFEDHSALFNVADDNQSVNFDTSELTFGYDQLFRDTRFSGGDRIDDANQLSVGLTTRFFGNDSGLEWFNASLGRIFYFDDRRVTLTDTPEQAERSDIALQVNANPIQGLRFTGNALFDWEEDRVRQWNVKTRYQSPSKHLIELDYRYTKADVQESPTLEDTRQLNGAVIAELFNPRWHLLAYSAWDIERNRELDSVAAIEYNGCCVRFRVGYRSELDNHSAAATADGDLDYDYSVFVEIHLKGLAGTSDTLDNLFEDKIDGFGEWQSVYNQQ